MKKICLLFIIMLLVSNIAFAKNAEGLFVVKNTMIKSFSPKMKLVLTDPTIDGNVFYSVQNNYFIHLYQSDADIDIFINCDKKEQELYYKKLKTLGFKIYSFEDKDLRKKYSSDFNNYIKLNDICIGKNTVKKNKVRQYDDKPLKNKILKTVSYSENGIDFVINKVQLKTKIKKYVDGYEIIITNNTDNNILLKKIETGDFIGLTEIAKKAAIPAGVDFIPLYGIVAGIKTDLEKNKFTRPFPTNYTLKKKDSIRLLGMAKLQVLPIIDFIFEIKGRESIIQLRTF